MITDVDIVITRDTLPLTVPGYGLPLVVGTAGAVAYAEAYSLADVVAAGHADTTDVYKMAEALFRQNPGPNKIAVVGFANAADVPADLNTLIQTENDWYFLLCTTNTDVVSRALAGWAATNKKLYVCAPDSGSVAAIITLAGQSEFVGNDRAVLIYHNEPRTGTNHVDAAWVGKCAAFHPGSITWKFKALNGISPVGITATNVGDLHGANVNAYINKLGVAQTSQGLTTGGEYIDITRGMDWVEQRLSQQVHSLLFNSPKVPYDNRGIAMVVAEVRSVMQQAVAEEIIAQDRDGNGLWTVTAPNREDIPSADIAARILPDVEFTFIIAGAIHEVEIRGVVQV